jgi:hypothetical protein
MSDTKPSDDRNGCFLDKLWCCKVCDGEIPDGHTDNCDIWKLEKKHKDFLANEYNAVLEERDRLRQLLRDVRPWIPNAPYALPIRIDAALCFANDAAGDAKP